MTEQVTAGRNLEVVVGTSWFLQALKAGTRLSEKQIKENLVSHGFTFQSSSQRTLF